MSENIVNAAIIGIQNKKGKNIVNVNLTQLDNSECDYFLISEADSTTQVRAIADSVAEMVQKETKLKVWHSDGYDNSQWIVLDYGNVMVHVFQTQTRSFYDLESLWADAEIQHIIED